MKKGFKYFVVSLVVSLAVLPTICFGIDAAALMQLLDQGDKVTVIDIRSRQLYQAGHIRGAINISANIIDRKPLPAVGEVVVCGDGVHHDITMDAVTALNAKIGINADFLEGGFPAWDQLNLPKTQKPGIVKQQSRYITYQDLHGALESSSDMVLVDIRRFKKNAKQSKKLENGFTDLSAQFPGVEIISPDALTLHPGRKGDDVSLSSIVKNSTTVYVIVGRGDGKEEEVARRMYGAGIRQCLILVGGEIVLQRKGKSGSKTEISGD